MAWTVVSEPNSLPLSLRAGLGAAPVFSPNHSAWFVANQGKVLRYGFGDAQAFSSARSNLQGRLRGLINTGDELLGVDPGSALQVYKDAGNYGASTLGPQIDNAGAPQVTQPLTQQAWGLNSQLSGAADTSSAKGLVERMYELYREAINRGEDSVNPVGPPTGPTYNAALALDNYLAANGCRDCSSQELGDLTLAFKNEASREFPGRFSFNAQQMRAFGPGTDTALTAILRSARRSRGACTDSNGRCLGGGASPVPAPPAPAPAPLPSPTYPEKSSRDYTVPILVGAGVLAAGIVAWKVYGKK